VREHVFCASSRSSADCPVLRMAVSALDRRRMLRRLTEERMGRGLSQTAVAAEMGTSQSAIARIESGRADVKISTLERYAATLGRKVEWRLGAAISARTPLAGPGSTGSA
jgi:DNA-binding XRE family transcriptional regulator